MIFPASCVALIVALSLTRHLCKSTSYRHLLDHPNARSLHSRPVPRSGGVAVLAGLLAGALVLYLFSGDGADRLISLTLGLVPVVLVSFWDDYDDVHPLIRLLAQSVAAVALLVAGYGFDLPVPPLLNSLAALVYVVWMMNLYNFMDGMDGLAGGMAVIGFSCFAIFGLSAGDVLFANASWLVVASSLGFLVFNIPPARIFLGDTGSITLGFCAAAFGLWGNRSGLFPWWVPILIFSPFIADATVTLLCRLFRGEKVWLAHKTHYYQRLVQAGWSQRKVLFAEYFIMLSCSGSALVAVSAAVAVQIGVLVCWAIVYIGLIVAVNRLEHSKAQLS